MKIKELFFKEYRTTTILSSIYFVLGMLFCILPNIMMDTFETFFCVFFLTYGGIIMIAYCISAAVFKNIKLMLSAIISIFLGVLLLFVRSFFILGVALCICLFAFVKIKFLIKMKQSRNFNWYLLLSLAIIYCLSILTILVFYIMNKF